MTEIKADAECFETVYARENLGFLPEPEPEDFDPEAHQDRPDPKPTGRMSTTAEF